MFLFQSRSTRSRRSAALSSFSFLLALGLGASGAAAHPVDHAELDLLCPLVETERQRDLEDARISLELVENEYRTRRQVFGMIEKLWQARAIDQEDYLDYKRLRDRTRVRIDRTKARIAQREGIVEQYELACARLRGGDTEGLDERIARLRAEHGRLECEVLARDAEIAKIDYVFDRDILQATRALRERNVKSKYEVVIDEYDLSQSKARSESYRRRARQCKRQLAE